MLSTSSMFCSSCSSQKLKNRDSGRQVYTASPAWTLKQRLEEMQQIRSPGPVYDVSRGYKYLEQVRLCASQLASCQFHCSGHIQAISAVATWSFFVYSWYVSQRGQN